MTALERAATAPWRRVALAAADASRRLAAAAVRASGWAALAACSGAAATEPAVGDAATAFPAAAAQTVDGESGAVRVEVRTQPQPPERGLDAAELTVTRRDDGGPCDGLTLAVTPWMPAMNHGTSLVPTITPEAGGRYLVQNLDLYMPGHWELRVSVSGPLSDRVAPAFDIP